MCALSDPLFPSHTHTHTKLGDVPGTQLSLGQRRQGACVCVCVSSYLVCILFCLIFRGNVSTSFFLHETICLTWLSSVLCSRTSYITFVSFTVFCPFIVLSLALVFTQQRRVTVSLEALHHSSVSSAAPTAWLHMTVIGFCKFCVWFQMDFVFCHWSDGVEIYWSQGSSFPLFLLTLSANKVSRHVHTSSWAKIFICSFVPLCCLHWMESQNCVFLSSTAVHLALTEVGTCCSHDDTQHTAE